jgi:hypothetical protein
VDKDVEIMIRELMEESITIRGKTIAIDEKLVELWKHLLDIEDNKHG